jgi:hypothetical protein
LKTLVTAVPFAPFLRTSPHAELIDLVLKLAANSGKTTVSAINQEGCCRERSFSSGQYGHQRLSKMLGGWASSKLLQ